MLFSYFMKFNFYFRMKTNLPNKKNIKTFERFLLSALTVCGISQYFLVKSTSTDWLHKIDSLKHYVRNLVGWKSHVNIDSSTLVALRVTLLTHITSITNIFFERLFPAIYDFAIIVMQSDTKLDTKYIWSNADF